MLSIGIGSKTSTGGVVIEGNQGLVFDGLVASSVGHQATCPACKKGVGSIVAVGPRTVNLPAGPAARAGDYVACGCPPGANTLIADGTITLSNAHAGVATAASLIPGLIPQVRKRVDRLYFTHGEERTPLGDISRFYVDVNLHADTSGYSPGETLDIVIAGATELSLSGRVDQHGKVFIPGVFGSQLPLQGEI